MKFFIRSVVFTGIIVFLWSATSCFAAGEKTMDLSDEKYFPQVHKILLEAKESIYVLMHIMEIGSGREDDPTEQLVQDLIDAHQRGVKVKVILDKNSPEVEEALTEFEKVGNKNDKSHALLKNEGLDVSFDSSEVVTMSSLIVVDEYLSVFGSAFWCYESLVENFESSTLMESKRMAKKRLEYILKVESRSKDYIQNEKGTRAN